MTVRDSIVAFAQAQEGKPYVWGATGPNAYDCSGLVYAAEKAAGLNVTRSTSNVEVQRGTKVDRAQAAPGDLVYVNGGGYEDHSGIYVGGGQMIDAPTQGKPVGVHSVPTWASFWTPPGQSAATAAEGAGATSTAAGQGFVAQNAGFLGLPSGDDIVSLVMKAGAGLVAGALVVVGLSATVKGTK